MLKGAGDAEEQDRAAPGTPDAKKRKRETKDGDGAPSGAGLCDDVVGNILARLPARAAVACTALSKRHRRLIRSPEFRSLHRRLAPPLPRSHVAFLATAPIKRRPKQKDPVSRFVGFHVAGAGVAAPMRSLAGRRYLNMKYVNTCNGIVLLTAIANRKKEGHSADSSCRCILWNPAIADVVQEVTVPDPPAAGSKYLVLGLGYGQRSKTYKLLLLSSGHSRRHGFVTYQLGNPEKKQPIAVSSFGLNADEIIRQHSLYMDGKIYLLSRKDLAIFAFDVDDETVTSIDLPAMELHEDLRWFGFSSLMELSGRPCVVTDHDDGGMAVWLLSVDDHRHRWEQKCLIGKLRLGGGISLCSTIGVWECGDVLVLTVEDYCHQSSGYYLFLYDVTAEKMFKAKLHREVAPEWSFSLGYDLCWGYRPTLVSPGGIVGKLDDEDKERCRECSKGILKALKPVAEQDKRKGMKATLGIMCFMDFLVRIMQMLPKDLQQVVEMTMVDSDDPDISFERVPFARHGIRETRKSA